MMKRVQNVSQYGMWNCTAGKHQAAAAPADGSWDVRAFAAEDTVSRTMARNYTCSFCRREFRSAQALGGHMNVHRRDRARRLCQSEQGPAVEPSPASLESVAAGAAGGGGLCFFYPTLPSRDGPVFPRAIMESPSNLLSMFPYQAAANFPTVMAGSDDSFSSDTDGGGLDEEIDLELRLGWP